MLGRCGTARAAGSGLVGAPAVLCDLEQLLHLFVPSFPLVQNRYEGLVSAFALSSSEETVEKWENLMVLTRIIQQTNIRPSPHFLVPPSPHTPWLTVLSLGFSLSGAFS